MCNVIKVKLVNEVSEMKVLYSQIQANMQNKDNLSQSKEIFTVNQLIFQLQSFVNAQRGTFL